MHIGFWADFKILFGISATQHAFPQKRGSITKNVDCICVQRSKGSHTNFVQHRAYFGQIGGVEL